MESSRMDDSKLTRDQKYDLIMTLGRWVVFGIVMSVAFISRIFIG